MRNEGEHLVISLLDGEEEQRRKQERGGRLKVQSVTMMMGSEREGRVMCRGCSSDSCAVRGSHGRAARAKALQSCCLF